MSRWVCMRCFEGEITRSGNMAVTELRVGDCFDLQDAAADQVDNVTARPCGESHQFELIHVGSMPAGDYPDDAGFAAWLGGNCVPAFEAYVGIGFEVSRYDITWFQPTADGWDQGDRSVQCAAVDPNQDRLSGSVRNAAR